jgi:CheY-like chemotaxis protein
LELLVIEDDEDCRAVVREILEEEGYRVRAVANGHDALARLHAGPRPDLILTDLCMPVMDGWAVVAAMAALPDLAETPVVVMSASGKREAPACAAYLQKPIPWDRLLTTIADCLPRPRPRLLGAARAGTST